MQRTNIEYLDYTYNPIAMRCTRVSAGCKNCWHLRMEKRLSRMRGMSLADREAHVFGIPTLRVHELEAPLHLRKPSRIGVQFMGDLFHESVPQRMRSEVLLTMNIAKQHQFFILTKRPQNMRPEDSANIWFGVSVEDRASLPRLDILRSTPAAQRFVSFEPLLEDLGEIDLAGIDLVIVGGETGPGARMMKPDWVRSIRNRAKAAGIPCFFKAWGSYKWKNIIDLSELMLAGYDPDKRNGGNVLDGRTWKELPE